MIASTALRPLRGVARSAVSVGLRPTTASLGLSGSLLRSSMFASRMASTASATAPSTSTSASSCCSGKTKTASADGTRATAATETLNTATAAADVIDTHTHTPAAKPSPLSRSFWRCKHTWRRAGVNTFRCLIGCSIGDLSMMWYLMAYHPDMAMSTSMGLSMAAGITTSIALETTLLALGKDKLPWGGALKTAMGMSMISMLAMEASENLVTLALANTADGAGMLSPASPEFWAVTAVSMLAGFVVPLPYNYWRLKALGKACH